jgi:hypothetical protein
LNERLGLIAGAGALPAQIARSAADRGHRVTAIAFHGVTEPELSDRIDRVEWLYLGEVEALLRLLHDQGIRRVVMAGKVDKTHLYRAAGRSQSTGRAADAGPLLRPDARARELLERLKDRRDDSILRALAELLESEGIELEPQPEWVPHLMAGEGCLGTEKPSAEELADVAFAWPIAKSVARLDIGQSVVVKRGAVLAIEAIEGTDAAVRRGGALGGEGVCVLKVAKPGQDPRFDVPTIGPGTVDVLVESGARLLAFEAHRTIVLERAEMVQRADGAGIVLLGVSDPEDAAGADPEDAAGADPQGAAGAGGGE